MTFTEAIKSAFTNYAVFSGRSGRPAFWYFFLFNLIVSFVLTFFDGLIDSAGVLGVAGVITLIWSLALFLPSLGLAVRRLHDIDRSGWWILIGLIPVIGVILLIIFYVMPGTQGENRFGPQPSQ